MDGLEPIGLPLTVIANEDIQAARRNERAAQIAKIFNLQGFEQHLKNLNT